MLVAHCFVTFNFNPQPGFLVGWQSYANLLVHFVFNENAAVVMFFVISGYVLGLQLDGLKSLPAFYVRRIFRIAPAMWAAVVIAFSLQVAYGEHPDHRLLLDALVFNGKMLLGPLWTVSVEMACSLAFPLLYFCSRRFGGVANLIVFAGLVYLMGDGAVPEWARYLVFFHAGLLLEPVGTLAARSPILAPALIAYGVTAPLCAIFGGSILLWLQVTGLASFVILSKVVHAGAGGVLLRLPAIRFLGRISYSLYLLHYIVIELVARALLATSFRAPPIAMQIVVFAFAAPISIIVAKVMYDRIEKPFIALCRRAFMDGLHPKAVM